MSGTRVRQAGARIDTTRQIRFCFDGRNYTGHPGDTLASALLAQGVRCVARSFKYGRPRGIVGAGAEEPNALVQLGVGALTTPNLKATQVELYEGLSARPTSGWPSLECDVKSLLGLGARFMPAGFYGKTFKWPRRLWPLYEALIRKCAGFGAAPDMPDPECYDHLHHHVDVLVVGAGACGLLAALQAGRAGLKTLLLDEQSEPGGWLLSDPAARIDGRDGDAYIRSVQAALSGMPHVDVLTRSTAFGMHAQNLVHAVELVQDHIAPAGRLVHLPRQRLHKIRARQVVLATGAIERPLVFGNNDLPGVMTVSAAQTFLQRYGVRVGQRVLICGTSDLIHDGAEALAQAGARVTVADVRHGACARNGSYQVLAGHGIAEACGGREVTGARLVALHATRDEVAGPATHVACDVVLSSGGLSPTVHLFCHDGSHPAWDETAAAFVLPRAGRQGVACVGAVTGAFDLPAALAQTTEAMQGVLAAFGRSAPLQTPDCPTRQQLAMRPMFRMPDGRPEGAGAVAFVDYQNDVSAADIEIAVRENYHAIEHVKRYTALGFGTDQGKLSNVNGIAITARALKRSMGEVGTTTYRPAYTPVSLGALAGTMVQDCFDPSRYTALHAAHVARGAALEPVGQWLRPWYFPRAGEGLRAAVGRECLAARNGVALMDASTLGKIQIDGPDAREFLNRVYANAWTQLAVGKCRYGLMLDENGMVMDDGVTACITPNQFYMTTTTGGAARVLNWLERWHQSEWPELRVWLTSVTDHWSTIALVGPKARAVLARLCPDIDLSAENFRFMDWRAGTVHGLPARVFRVSFSGELAYELNVESGYGHALWEAVIAAGADFDITPYGTETMHVLRAEKGFIIVGQDTDGSVSPLDLGMGWAVGMKKAFSFLGKRSLARSDTARADRKQLVGLLPEDPSVVLSEGAQIMESAHVGAHNPMLGHVTSSYHSAFLGRSIALAVVAGGSQRVHQTLYAHAQGRATAARVAGSVFVDAQGERQNA
ncbi:sarcosine oxidase subunit alpha family protein [Verminephrobacter aporrectodeae subsp. tuberculatae]|uniref:sarcosine oxidase subunit alpha family protein n=1 Tax=Verminephrobacter aporrectodeae TaxID=1110389 RepID=UPI00224308B2|nr:sarcosine oxidase subunit alpha family protein [Verminephrobacter aporrectodeae]MCW8209234.1 sarcosine oxidase subunit alpha family protein [Verminephrobacter aporrectodeae subsp. tuberculatae]